MDKDALLPAIEALKTKVAMKEQEIAPLRQQLEAKDAEINPLREMINGLCKEAGLPPAYAITKNARSQEESAPKMRFRADQFFNKELSQAAVEYLTAKKASDPSGSPTPATTDEIYTALTSHGYTFSGSNVANNKVSLKTALTRNTAQIAKINDDLYGLRSWYGLRAKYKRSGSDGADGADEQGAEPKAETPDASKTISPTA